MEMSQKPPASFWVIATFAIVWNIIEFYLTSYEFNLIQQDKVDGLKGTSELPIWFISVFLLALFCEMLGAFALFMRRKIAVILYRVAVFALIVVEIYWFTLIDLTQISILLSIVTPVVVIAVAVCLLYYSLSAVKKGWIR